ncbi:hypothetical protein M9458_054241 [Cirrhinus mrigala]|uniref:Uncharacterized protein n=1 Tax=Cirrhinus mrigala TaxID=683832 RepID=A0ABD0MKM6_CIRMR
MLGGVRTGKTILHDTCLERLLALKQQQSRRVGEQRQNRGWDGGTVGQVRAEEVGLDRGAVTDSEALEGLGHGTVADSGTLEDLGCGAVADTGTLKDLGRGAVANSGTLEDLGHGAVVDNITQENLGRGTLEQKSTMVDSEEPGAMAGQTEQAKQGAMAGHAEQTGAKIPTVEQMTSISEQRVHG